MIMVNGEGMWGLIKIREKYQIPLHSADNFRTCVGGKTMLSKILIFICTIFIMCIPATAAEIYNKNGNKLDFYGKVDARYIFTSDSSSEGDNTIARIGFRGLTEINDSLKGYGRWEYNMAGNRPEGSTAGTATRLAFAGLDFLQYGTVDYGRNLGILYDAEAATDMAPVWGGDTWARHDSFMTKRASGLLTWRSPELSGFRLALQLQGKNDRDTASKSNGDGGGVSLRYSPTDNLQLVTAWSRASRTDLQQSDGLGDRASAWVSSVRYDDGSLYLAAMYSQARNLRIYGPGLFAPQAHSTELMAQYQFDNGLRPSLGYLYSRGESLPANGAYDGGSATLTNYFTAGFYYYFNKNMTVYADYKINLLRNNSFTNSSGLYTGNSLGTGIIYQF